MDYGSSYAVGGPQPAQRDDGRRHAVHARVDVLPAPKPQRVHWSTMLFVAGMSICAIALLVTVAGVPSRLGYDRDSPGNRNEPTSSDPLALSRSLDGNMKWIAESTANGDGTYVGSINAINRNVAALPAMVQVLVAMDASVKSIDAGLGDLGTVTEQMGADMQAMAEVSSTSGATMTALDSDIGFLSTSMLELATSTQQLTERMAGIERRAGGIARGGTAEALKSTEALNASLPDNVPVPLTDDGKPLDQAMARLAQGGGTSSNGAVDQGALAK